MKEHIWIPSRNQRISAMLHLPDNFRAGTPLLVLCHGFTGNKVGYNHLTLNLAVFLERRGYGVLRFDYVGSGDSDGDFSVDTSVTGWREDLNNVLHWVGGQKQFAASPVILYGHSLGGLVVLTHKDTAKRVAARIVFAPVTKPVENFRDIIIGRELWQKSLKGHRIENFFDKGFTLYSQFVKDLVKHAYDPIGTASTHTTPLLIIHGMADTVVPLAGSQELYEQYRAEKELVIADFDHGALGKQDEFQNIIGQRLAGLVAHSLPAAAAVI
ncbi:hypothetical protein P22_3135 [Propionispora sp. 2/2-37]|uniref:alpha/beta hydrolase n=1 Tax=Propionispora sp. 2/2-37 TaxID=1677858 RepID=UPI0006BB9755|nr:alpha/beta fold hydrolase [Propionispora sp. 2/2-37]CUH97009.1 hypothetical protein P22_3135 [Propionispora sp. 2/2-37]